MNEDKTLVENSCFKHFHSNLHYVHKNNPTAHIYLDTLRNKYIIVSPYSVSLLVSLPATNHYLLQEIS